VALVLKITSQVIGSIQTALDGVADIRGAVNRVVAWRVLHRDASTGGFIARVGRAGVAGVASYGVKLAIASGSVARVNCTLLSVIALLRNLHASFGGVARRSETRIGRSASDIVPDASVTSTVAEVRGTAVLEVAGNLATSRGGAGTGWTRSLGPTAGNSASNVGAVLWSKRIGNVRRDASGAFNAFPRLAGGVGIATNSNRLDVSGLANILGASSVVRSLESLHACSSITLVIIAIVARGRRAGGLRLALVGGNIASVGAAEIFGSIACPASDVHAAISDKGLASGTDVRRRAVVNGTALATRGVAPAAARSTAGEVVDEADARRNVNHILRSKET